MYHMGRARYYKDKQLQRLYGITIDDFESMVEAVGGTCEICNQPETRSRGGKVFTLSVDHCHDTGVVRGILCHDCNTLLGKAKDNCDTLGAAINYLRTPR